MPGDMSGYTAQSRSNRSWFKIGDNWETNSSTAGKQNASKATTASSAIDLKTAVYSSEESYK